MNIKRIIKIVVGIIIFMTLPGMLLYGFLYYKYNEDLPVGIKGKEADVLASKMLNALNSQAYDNTGFIEWTFKSRRHYKWKKNEYKCTIYWGDFKVFLDFKNAASNKAYIHNFKVNGEQAQELITEATDYFFNDSFWLAAPYKVFDEGTERQAVTLDNDNQGLLVSYSAGDSYLWLLDNEYKPKAFKMWSSKLPIQGLEASWDNWIVTESNAQLPTAHRFLISGIELDIMSGKH